jgi:hypothetical protein
MPNTVITIKKSATPTAVPSALEHGELAINYADGKLFYKNVNNQIVEVPSGGGGDNFGTVNVGGTLIVADVTGDVLTLAAGDNITLTPHTGNDTVVISAAAGSDPVTPIAFNQANTAYNQANAAYEQANTRVTTGKAIAMAIVFG